MKPPIRGTMTHALTEGIFHNLAVGQLDADKDVAWLEKHHAFDLARVIARCRPHDRCLSPACTMCGHAEQYVMAAAFKNLALRHRKTLDIGFVNLVPVEYRFKPGSLCEFDVPAFRRDIRDRLARTDVVFAAGGIDLTLNMHREGAWSPFWQPTAELLVGAEDLDLFRDQIAKQFHKDDPCPRSIRVEKWDGRDRLFPYLTKPDSHRRITIPNGLRYDKRRGVYRQCRITSNDRLRVIEKIAFLRFLHLVGTGGRLITRNTSLRLHDGKLRFDTSR